MNNDEQEQLSRRHFLQSLGLVGIAGASGSLLAACGGSDDSSDNSGEACADLSGLSEQEMEQRKQMVESLNYVHESPQDDQFCSNCQLYIADEYGKGCGGCQLFPGSVHAEGYCNSWAPAT